MFALSFLLGSGLGSWIFKREHKPPESLDRLMLYMFLGTILGARLGEVLFYNPGYYFSNPLEVFKIWHGGLASHGAGIGLLVSLYIYSKRTPGQSYLWILDRASMAIALACSMIRVGNLFNSEIIGKPTNSSWGFVFQRIDNLPRHPTQIYESALYLMIFFILVFIYRTVDTNKSPGILIGTFFITMFSARFFVEFFKENQVNFESGWFFNMGQFLSVPMIAIGIIILIKTAFVDKHSVSSR